MAVNLVENVAKAIGEDKVTEQHCWSDSTVALYWIGSKEQGNTGSLLQTVLQRFVLTPQSSGIMFQQIRTPQIWEAEEGS